jgi:hypothetical protein
MDSAKDLQAQIETQVEAVSVSVICSSILGRNGLLIFNIHKTFTFYIATDLATIHQCVAAAATKVQQLAQQVEVHR